MVGDQTCPADSTAIALHPSHQLQPCLPLDDVPFPIPSDLVDLRGDGRGLPNTWPPQLRSLYRTVGTWEVPESALHEALKVRVALPMRLEPPHARPEIDELESCLEKLDEALELRSIESEAWKHIEAAKNAERTIWGCFNDAPFPHPRSFSISLEFSPTIDPLSLRREVHEENQSITTALAADESAWTLIPEAMLKDSLHGPDTCCELPFLRSELHENTFELITTIHAGESAWRMLPQSVVNAVPHDAWVVNASGGFCLRQTSEPDCLAPSAPPSDWCCVICLDDDTMQHPVSTLCGHMFHHRCLQMWFRMSRRCPLCRCKCRFGPALTLPEMKFDLDSWPMLPQAVIANDDATRRQLEVAKARTDRPMNESMLHAKRRRLDKRFGVDVRPGFLKDQLPLDENDICSIGPAVVAARWRCAREQATAKVAELEAYGRKFVSWAVDGKWPVLQEAHSRAARRDRLTRRLAARWSEMRPSLLHRSCKACNQKLAQLTIRGCYMRSQEKAVNQKLARLVIQGYYLRSQENAECGKDGAQCEKRIVASSSSQTKRALTMTLCEAVENHDIETIAQTLEAATMHGVEDDQLANASRVLEYLIEHEERKLTTLRLVGLC